MMGTILHNTLIKKIVLCILVVMVVITLLPGCTSKSDQTDTETEYTREEYAKTHTRHVGLSGVTVLENIYECEYDYVNKSYSVQLVKFEFTDVLYISYYAGSITPVFESDGTPLTYDEYLESHRLANEE